MEWPHWSVYIVLFVAWIWQNAVHELSHLIAAWKYHRCKPLGFYPYPHTYKGRFYFARYKCEPYKLPGHPGVHMAPLYGAVVQSFLVSLVVLLLGEVGSWWYVVGVLCPAVDSLWWVGSYYWGKPHSDGQQFKVSIDYLRAGGRSDEEATVPNHNNLDGLQGGPSAMRSSENPRPLENIAMAELKRLVHHPITCSAVIRRVGEQSIVCGNEASYVQHTRDKHGNLEEEFLCTFCVVKELRARSTELSKQLADMRASPDPVQKFQRRNAVPDPDDNTQ